MLTKFGTCRKCMFLTAVGLTGSLLTYGAAVFAGVEMLKPVMLAVAFFAAWSLLHGVGYVVNGREGGEGCKECSSIQIARRSFIKSVLAIATLIGLGGVASALRLKQTGTQYGEVIQTDGGLAVTGTEPFDFHPGFLIGIPKEYEVLDVKPIEFVKKNGATISVSEITIKDAKGQTTEVTVVTIGSGSAVLGTIIKKVGDKAVVQTDIAYFGDKSARYLLRHKAGRLSAHFNELSKMLDGLSTHVYEAGIAKELFKFTDTIKNKLNMETELIRSEATLSIYDVNISSSLCSTVNVYAEAFDVSFPWTYNARVRGTFGSYDCGVYRSEIDFSDDMYVYTLGAVEILPYFTIAQESTELATGVGEIYAKGGGKGETWVRYDMRGNAYWFVQVLTECCSSCSGSRTVKVRAYAGTDGDVDSKSLSLCD